MPCSGLLPPPGPVGDVCVCSQARLPRLAGEGSVSDSRAHQPPAGRPVPGGAGPPPSPGAVTGPPRCACPAPPPVQTPPIASLGPLSCVHPARPEAKTPCCQPMARPPHHWAFGAGTGGTEGGQASRFPSRQDGGHLAGDRQSKANAIPVLRCAQGPRTVNHPRHPVPHPDTVTRRGPAPRSPPEQPGRRAAQRGPW